MSNKSPQEKSMADWISANKGYFELMVLATALFNRKIFFELMSASLCWQPSPYKNQPGEWVDDFSEPIISAVYRVLRDYHWIMAQGKVSEYGPIGELQAARSLQSLTDLLLPNEVPRALEVYRAAREMYTDDVGNYVRAAFKFWHGNQTLSRVFRTALHSGNSSGAIEQVMAAHASMSVQNRPKLSDFMSGVNYHEPWAERIPTRIRGLDRAFGGGLGRAESFLFVGAKGTGKTVLSTQLAAQLAAGGYKVGLISTEQPSHELVRRMISSQCDVPFNMVVDGIDFRRIPPEFIPKIEAYSKIMSPQNYQCFHWDANMRQYRLQDYMAILIEEFKLAMGGLDVLLLDWLGRALGSNVATDKDKLRLALKDAANFMVDVAVKENIATVDFGQADPAKAYDRWDIDASMIAECKSLGENKTAVVGISGMRHIKGETHGGDNEAPIFVNDQRLYLAAARKSEGYAVRVRRDFKFQRFTER